MGNRLSKIYTRTGDEGSTGLGDGSRVSKTHPRVGTFGTVDELNSLIGMILAHDLPQEVRDCLVAIQHDLFDLGGELSVPGYEAIDSSYTERLERELDAFNDKLPDLKEFILPAGGIATSTCHLARAVCRRAERDAVALAASEAINPAGLIYLNRLSDLLFVIARVLARFENGEEVLWQPGKNR
ncbi:cob(I)yrinic acid a,c-diamide adenosyltransferase [Thiohalophilus thiocyanatoxydans]|uniref:Corrinoid adenosyltransferase n=1 Tax=Thiohalophilus thiocyanatoxydans TaxID=381308 RepID=A0A4R8IPN6_9GAMM|nr:cob(I)yrinic acid a,c-diamide adenosyltransferase [Thiohalophilus thiocyanatoxydans]TDX99378.1 ATP:cob(I)alamin adenosyltransferase [Thiohalophilus thiocyanatoxydans]